MEDQELQTLLADVTEHTRTLNNVLRRLSNAGIRVRVASAPDHVSVRVWREEELLKTEQ